ncbi:hypothetical protein IAU60_001731 [Kwoniella sp. DSM 27419]
MGVRGLEYFIKENRTSLCRTIQLPSVRKDGQQSGEQERTPVVVDAWGIIFKLWLDSLPWASGGEYLMFYKIVKRLIGAWRRVGLEPIFVFDGPAPAEKHETMIRRGQEKITACQLFYTTSVPSRSAPSFSRQSRGVVLPFFASHTFIFALHRLGVKTHFVPQGEADAICVVMADQVGGYLLGRDSDFAVMIGRTDRCKGYVPLDMISWIEGEVMERPAPPQEGIYQPPGARAQATQAQMTGFQQVKGRRTQNDSRHSSLLPSPSYTNPTLVFTVIPPQALRQRLRLPATHLALFASLCGTDYTPPEMTQQFFEPNLDAIKRIEKAARILREQLFAPSAQQTVRGGSISGANTPNPADQVVQLVKKVIKKLCIYPFDTEQALDDAVDLIIDAALQYQLPHGGSCCSTYPFCGELDAIGCQTPIRMSLDEDEVALNSAARAVSHKQQAKEAYAEARRRGLLGSITHGWLFPDRMYLWHVLDDPSAPNWKTTNGAKDIRRKAWVIADEGLGGLRWPLLDEEGADPSIMVQALRHNAEMISGPGRLGGSDDIKDEDKALRELLGVDPPADTHEGDGQEHPAKSEADDAQPIRAVIEWCRPGTSTKLAACPLVLPPLVSLGENEQPTCLLPLEQRSKLYLAAQRSDTAAIRALPLSIQPIVALIRTCVMESALRPSGRTDAHRWRAGEAAAVLRATLGSYAMWLREMRTEWTTGQGQTPATTGSAEEPGRMFPLLESRNAAIVAQYSSAWADTHLLAQALLLMPDIAGVSTEIGAPIENLWDVGPTHMIPFVLLSGINLHLCLSKTTAGFQTGWQWGTEEQAMFDQCWEALVVDLEPGVMVGMSAHAPVRASLPPSTANGDSAVEGGGQNVGEKHAVESDGDKKKNRRKKRKSQQGGAPVVQHQGSGRFDLLGELEM